MIAMRVPAFFKRKKLRATTARRSLGRSDDMDYEMSEPNMKLSRALLIVLVLHVVAVAGIVAFNAIKTRQGSIPVTSKSSVETASARPDPVAKPASAKQQESKPSHSPSKITGKAEHAKKPGAAVAAADSGKIYVVAKGDNPVTIARKLNVPYDELLSLNHIDDPRKLQIGQKLLVPAKTTKTKKPGE